MFKVSELLKATKGKLVSGKANKTLKGVSLDTRRIRPDEVFVAIKGQNFDGHNFIGQAVKKGAGCIICDSQAKNANSQKVAWIKVRNTVRALGDIARFQREKFDIPVIAVTGSNGKTSAKEMIAWVLSRQFKVLKNEGTKNNHIGLPQTLLNLNGTYDLAVLEIGTNHFGEVEYLAKIARPNIGVITNIGASHLEHFKDLNGVFKEKHTMLKYLKPPAITIFNTDDSLLKRKVSKREGRGLAVGVGINNRADFMASGIKTISSKTEFLINQKYRTTLNTLGSFNIYNALIAVAVGRILGMAYKDIASRVASFDFPKNRLDLIEVNNTKFIDDTYNSNPASLKQALSVLENFKINGRKIFVMGDMLELGRMAGSLHRQAGRIAAGVCGAFICVGKLSRFAAEAAERVGLQANSIFTCDNSVQARDILKNTICPSPDDIVLVKGSHAMHMEEVLKI